MIFNSIHSNDMFHMMDWGSDIWYFLIIGGFICFFVIAIILLYIMRKGTKKLESIESSGKNTKTEDLTINRHIADTKFCPDCGVKLDEENVAYCQACGYKILRTDES